MELFDSHKHAVPIGAVGRSIINKFREQRELVEVKGFQTAYHDVAAQKDQESSIEINEILFVTCRQLFRGQRGPGSRSLRGLLL